MDIRGFTHWSESRSAEEVVAMLNRYYVVAESVLRQHRAIKFKFSADEVMAVFAEAGDACRAALGLRDETQPMLAGQGLGAGIGLHLGPLVVVGQHDRVLLLLEPVDGQGQWGIGQALLIRVFQRLHPLLQPPGFGLDLLAGKRPWGGFNGFHTYLPWSAA